MAQGVWLAESWQRFSLKEKFDGLCGGAVVALEVLREGLSRLEGDQRQEPIARERQIERGLGSAVTVLILLPGARVAFPMIAIFHTPVPADGFDTAVFLHTRQAGEEPAGMGFFGRLGLFLFTPAALHAQDRAQVRQIEVRRLCLRGGRFALVNAPVPAFYAEGKKGEPARSSLARPNLLEVFSLVPMT